MLYKNNSLYQVVMIYDKIVYLSQVERRVLQGIVYKGFSTYTIGGGGGKSLATFFSYRHLTIIYINLQIEGGSI